MSRPLGRYACTNLVPPPRRAHKPSDVDVLPEWDGRPLCDVPRRSPRRPPLITRSGCHFQGGARACVWQVLWALFLVRVCQPFAGPPPPPLVVCDFLPLPFGGVGARPATGEAAAPPGPTCRWDALVPFRLPSCCGCASDGHKRASATTHGVRRPWGGCAAGGGCEGKGSWVVYRHAARSSPVRAGGTGGRRRRHVPYEEAIAAA